VADLPLGVDGASGRLSEGGGNQGVEETRRSIIFVSSVSNAEWLGIGDALSVLLKLPCESLIVFFNSGNSTPQRRLLQELLGTGYWSIKNASPGCVVLVRHSSVYIEEDALQGSEIQTSSKQPEQSVERFSYSVFRDLSLPVLTSYFTSCSDPQGKATIKPDEFELLKPWADSIQKHGLTGVIFHDELSDEFINRHENRHLRFVRVPPSPSLSLNDYRFLVWRDWLSVNPVDAVFFSDLFDVVVNRDPFSIFESLGRPLMLSHQGKYIGETHYFIKNFKRVYGDITDDFKGLPELNAGVWGGAYSDVLRFLVIVSKELESALCPFNANMPVFNWVAYRRIGLENFWSEGEPFHSEFQKYDYGADVAFVHK
jgi:hypothetical protein